jgi:hypothetical protein
VVVREGGEGAGWATTTVERVLFEAGSATAPRPPPDAALNSVMRLPRPDADDVDRLQIGCVSSEPRSRACTLLRVYGTSCIETPAQLLQAVPVYSKHRQN